MERRRGIDSPRPQHAEADNLAVRYQHDFFDGSTRLPIDNPATNTDVFWVRIDVRSSLDTTLAPIRIYRSVKLCEGLAELRGPWRRE